MIINDLLVKGSARVVDKIYVNKIEGDLIGNADTASVAAELKTQPQLTSKSAMDSFLSGTGVKYATFNTSESGTGFQSNDGMILSLPWANSTAYGAQIAFDDAPVTNVVIRGKSTTWGDWYRLLHSGNYSSYALPLTGGTVTGGLTISNSNSSDTNGFFINRSGSSSEQVRHYVDDSYYRLVYTNDETTNAFRFEMTATDTESSDGTNKSSSVVTFLNSGNKSTVTADIFQGNATNALKANGVTPEWSGSINYTDTDYVAAWTSDGTKLKALAKNSFAPASHTHNYAGSSSAGGAATSANALNYTSTDEINFTGSSSNTNVYFNYRGSNGTSGNTAITKYYFCNRNTGHSDVQLVAGSFSGNAATATALTTNAGDSNTPVYFSGGKPVACTSLDLNTTGNAATATKAYILQGTYTSNGGAQPPSYVGANSVKCNMMNNFVGTDVSFSSYADVLMMNAYSWSDVPYATALAIQKTNGIPRAWIAAGGNTDAWSGATEIITKNNIGSQSVSSATKATQDANGNTITSTYATKTELANKVKIVRW